MPKCIHCRGELCAKLVGWAFPCCVGSMISGNEHELAVIHEHCAEAAPALLKAVPQVANRPVLIDEGNSGGSDSIELGALRLTISMVGENFGSIGFA